MRRNDGAAYNKKHLIKKKTRTWNSGRGKKKQERVFAGANKRGLSIDLQEKSDTT